ncbi:MAG: transcriptional regulator [Gemmatimonadota bacterium]|nr:transcriptional regulator [Gemmatimonadota bacterium]
MANTRQIVRQLDILRVLRARRHGASIQDLVDDFGVTRRTIERDLGDLGDAGFPLYAVKRGRQNLWNLVHDKEVPPLNFPVGELVALTYIAGIVEGTPFKEDFKNTFERIRNTLKGSMRAFLEQAAYHPQVRGQKAQVTPRIFREAHRAITDRRICNVTYRAIATGQNKTYPIMPFRFLYHYDGVYLLCRNQKYGDLLTLAAERIQDLEVTTESFEDAVDSEIEEQLRQAFGVVLESPISVRVRFTASQAPYIRQRIWHPSQEIEELDDGRIILSFEAGGRYEIKSWILSHGASAEVLAPASLREEIIDEMEKNLSFYKKT